jgi:hypothetical protein
MDRAYSNCLPELTISEWLAVLSLTMMWEMDDLCSAIRSKLSASATTTLDAAQQIHLALKFSIPGWIPAVVEKYVCRSEPPSAKEAEAMGFDMATKIWTMRERNRSKNVDRVRNDAHEKLFDVWARDCECKACDYAREVAQFPGAAPAIDYTRFDAGVRLEVQFMDVFDVEIDETLCFD